MKITNQTPEIIQETFLTGITGIFAIAGYRKMFFTYWTTKLPILISLITFIVVVILKVSPLIVLLEIKNNMINFLPSILGFTIAGYSLMVGFIQAGMLNKISEPSRDSKFSLYQKMSSTFAINIIFQAIALVIAYFVHFINYLDINRKLEFTTNPELASILNYIALIILAYWFCLSLFMIIQIVLNIFAFSQLHHYFINKEKVDKQAIEDEKTSDSIKKEESNV